MPSRREFLQQATAASASLSLTPSIGPPPNHLPSPLGAGGFIDLRRAPALIGVQTENGFETLTAQGPDRWTGASSEIRLADESSSRVVRFTTSLTSVLRLKLRWRGAIAETARVSGDCWERGYGELEWRGIVPDRLLPWYCAISDGTRTDGYGVLTGARAMCAWQVDSHGITLWADVRSGGMGLKLGSRVLDICSIAAREGTAGESAFSALRSLCHTLCPAPRLPAQPVYGHNDWYWAYGKNSADSVRADAARIVELSPTGPNRPFVVIDDGWQPGRVTSDEGSGDWDRGNEKFPDMASLTADIRAAGGRAGIWFRPLLAGASTPDNLRLSRDKSVLDPTVAAVRQKIHDDTARLAEWGYDLIKHDYSTWDLFGRWGFQMGGSLTRSGWSFAEGNGRTTAEIIDEMYGTIRQAAGHRLIIGCNTLSHLSAGRFELCRIGDDSSGSDWTRTRRMGINSLAFRAVQHGTFYAADPDCIAILKRQSWPLIRQWLDLVALSGTVFMTSIEQGALGAEQRRALVAALALAAEPRAVAQPLDWQRAAYSTHWRLAGVERTFDWADQNGDETIS